MRRDYIVVMGEDGLYTLNGNLAEPLHQQVEDYLREFIRREEYRNGKKMLPKEELMAKELGVSRNTFRAAMDRLVREGLVVRKKGVGTVVVQPKIATSLARWESFTREMDMQGREIRTLKKEIRWIAADEGLAGDMGIRPGQMVCQLDRLRGVEDEPVVLFQSYFHPNIRIRRDEQFDDKLYKLLEERYGCVVAISDEEIGAILSTPTLQTMLKITPDIPLLYRKRRVLDADNHLLEFCHVYYRSDRFAYSIQIRRDTV